MERIEQLNIELEQTRNELIIVKEELNDVFRQLWKIRLKKAKNDDYDHKRYEELTYANRLLQMERRKLITHMNFLNKEFYEICFGK
ncbi:hypothetical protein [uncultured Methanobrevibacter sp.]|uniref:hypothetical protein n=1 Tax=uncultured Methanobrevibacter sp. TaxID=253161 RepID=UPI002608B9BE